MSATSSKVSDLTAHTLTAREWRNGWLYMLCSCGREIGPFHNEDYAQDAFDLHTSGRDDLIGID